MNPFGAIEWGQDRSNARPLWRKVAEVDGETIKAKTLYVIENGEFVEKKV